MEAADSQFLEQLGELVGNLTASGNPSLNNDILKKLKGICKKSDVYVKHVYHLVMTQLKKNHAEVRLSSFQIINELFVRSHVFREMLLVDFQIFLELAVETDGKQPLPPPKCTAKILKDKALEAIERWFEKFGTHYKKLDLGYNYLKRVKKVEFHAISARTQAERRQAEEKERKKKNLIKGQIIRVENEMSEMIGEMELCATEMENCFKLLLPHPDDYEVHGGEEEPCCSLDFNNDANKHSTQSKDPKDQTENSPAQSHVSDSNSDKMQQLPDADNEGVDQQLLSDHGLASRSYQLSIQFNTSGPAIRETVDNSIVLDTVREMHKEMVHKHLPMITKWLSVLSRGEDMQSKLQQLIDLKRTLEAAKNKFLELKITPMTVHATTGDGSKFTVRPTDTGDDGDDDDTDDFEDVPEKEGLELVIPPNKRAEYGLEPLPTASSSATESSYKEPEEGTELLQRFGSDLRELGDPASRTTALYHVRNQLLSDANSSASGGDCEVVTDEKKKKLLQKAPVVPYDMDLYFWDNPSAQVPKMIKMYLDNHWGSKEYEGEYVLGDEKEARPTRVVTFAGNFEPVKWSCRAPLPSGKLCPRQDRVKCPFHGKIIPRDETGSPVNSDVSSEAPMTGVKEGLTAGTVEQDPNAEWMEVQRDIEAATGLDLGGKTKRKGKGISKTKNEKKELDSKSSGLTDLKRKKNTPRNRLEKVVLNKAAMRRVADEMDAIATRRCQGKFGNQFNYALTK